MRPQGIFGQLPNPIDHVMVTGGGPQYGSLVDMDATRSGKRTVQPYSARPGKGRCLGRGVHHGH